MDVIVLGAGAIGSLFGATLAATSNVTLLGRAEHVDAINANGLRIEGIDARIVRVRAATRIEEIGPGALVLVSTKAPDTSAAVESIADLVREDTTVLSLQNGLGTEKLVRAALRGRGVVLRGITQAGAIFERPGVIKYMAHGQTVIERHARSRQIASMFNRAGLGCELSSDIEFDVWSKLVFNCVVNPITTIIGGEVGAIADPRLDPLKQLVINECVTVAAAEGVHLTTDFLPAITKTFASSHNIVSMRQDLLRGRRTEIDYLNGAVAQLGARHGIACPVNAALTALIKALEQRAASELPQKVLEPQPA